jgi:hypothetical protein
MRRDRPRGLARIVKNFNLPLFNDEKLEGAIAYADECVAIAIVVGRDLCAIAI